MPGPIRLIHPFPSLLDGFVTTALALVVGGSVPTAIRLGLAMVALQASIGALNDLRDAPRDAVAQGGKPIPAGRVSPSTAWLVVAVGIVAGLLLSVPSGLATVAIALAGLGCGVAYDLWAKGTAWSWLPFAVGLVLLPLYAFVGATGSAPGWFAVLAPLALLAGAALAIANGLADLDRDTAAGSRSVASALGRSRALVVHAALLVVVLGLALAALSNLGGSTAALILTAGGGAVVIAGIWLTAGASATRRQRGWEVEAIGVGLAGAAWVAGVVGVV